MGNHLNFFYPYESKKPWHEDQLTRAFLVVLTYVPLAQSAFIEQIREAQRDQKVDREHLVPPYHTQKGGIRLIETQVNKVTPDQGEDGAERLLSLLITDKSWKATKPVAKSQRGARYDGVLQFGSFVMTLENKPYSEKVWEDQLHPAMDEDSDITIVEKPVVLLWPDIILTLRHLLVNGSLEVSQARLVDDFLQYVQDQFEYLNPFAKLSECEGSKLLIRKRLRALLAEIEEEVTGSNSTGSYSGGFVTLSNESIRRLCLWLEDLDGEPCIVLGLFPGDTMNQARAFFREDKVDRDKFLALGDEQWTGDWQVEQNLHFQFMRSHEHHVHEMKLNLAEYFDLWHSGKLSIHQAKRGKDGFKKTYDLLLGHGLITEKDVHTLEKKFANRQTMNICPGFAVKTWWDLDEAASLDDEGKFASEVLTWANKALRTWNEDVEIKPSGEGEAS